MISIHAPLARCDGTHPPLSCTDADFNPRTSCEVRRHRQNRSGSTDNFNPRTSCEVRLQEQVHRMRLANFNPRTSCEVRQRKGQRSIQRHYFNPRTSCEVRRSTVHYGHAASAFQSTHLLRGATIWISSTSLLSVFQSTHLLRGATPLPGHCPGDTHFNPRTSCEVRQLAIYAAYLLASLIHFREPHFFGWRATMFRFFLPCSLALRTHISFSP